MDFTSLIGFVNPYFLEALRASLKAFNRKHRERREAMRTRLRIDGDKTWNASLKRTGIENFRFHDLRIHRLAG